MQHSMFTRLTWHTFSGLFAQAAGEVLGVTDTEAMMEAPGKTTAGSSPIFPKSVSQAANPACGSSRRSTSPLS